MEPAANISPEKYEFNLLTREFVGAGGEVRDRDLSNFKKKLEAFHNDPNNKYR